jgi:hypothetical protein
VHVPHWLQVINDCGGIYFGMNVPVPVVSGLEPPPIWDFGPGEEIAGGHCMDGPDRGVVSSALCGTEGRKYIETQSG